MEKEDLRLKNAVRFSGFADTYERARPAVPDAPVRMISRYLGAQPELVVDLGSGTGLSTLTWKGNCARLIGVEPSADILAVAREKEYGTVSFIQAFADDTGLPEACADVAVCSQSFHWMEPVSTLAEVNRILRPGGVFATIDCDWPPVTDWRAEREYMRLYDLVKRLEREVPEGRDSFVRYPKDEHLANLKRSGYFSYCREVFFSNTESCTAERLIGLMLSQGSVQAVAGRRPEALQTGLKRFTDRIHAIFGGACFEIDFCYRMRIGVKRGNANEDA